MGRYLIAGLKVDMDSFGRTRKQAEAYAAAAEGPADITIVCDTDRLMERNPQLPDAETAQYLGTGAMFARELLAFNGSYLHASAVVLNGKAYLFSAPSGTGKSTHTEKWCRLFGATYLNDDKPVLRLVGDVWMAYGTPWSGKHDLSDPRGVPLGGVAFLRRGQENAIRRLTAKEALPRFMSQSLWRVPEHAQMEKQLALTENILQRIPIWELTCRNEDAAAVLARDVMTDSL